MHFNIGESTIILKDSDLLKLQDTGLEIGLEVRFDQICEIVKNDHCFLIDIAERGWDNQRTKDQFKDSICTYIIKQSFPKYPDASKLDQKKFIERLHYAAIFKGFKVVKQS